MKVIVPDMSCKHCVMTIEKSIVMSGLKAKVLLDDKSVTFQNEKDLEKIKQAIVKAGYTPEV
jgi:copper chaperone CopZ